ncbi:MAG: Exonuclease small subunit [Verrucomicrobiota bacterium]|jgi:exodeoxyribonuclease VII small subunit
MTRKKETATEAINFETSMAELEAIVEALEEESLSLSEMMDRYERGNQLIQQCDGFLKHAKLRLEKLSIREDQENVLASDQEVCQVPAPATPPTDHDDDSISLF